MQEMEVGVAFLRSQCESAPILQACMQK